MAWKTVELKLKSAASCPLICHNGELANPLNPLVKQIKKVTGKRSKTDADLEQMAKLEFIGSLYIHDGRVVLPSDVIEASLNGGARKFKEGPAARSGMYVNNNPILEFDGPTKPEQLWKDGSFVFQKMVVISRSRILRTRAIFNKWALSAEVCYEDSIVDLDQLKKWASTAGEVVGVGYWRPRYGRYVVEFVQ